MRKPATVVSTRGLVAIFLVLLLGLCGAGMATAKAAEIDPTEGWHLDLKWNHDNDAGRELVAGRDQPLVLAVVVTGADTLQGFQINVRIRRTDEVPGGAWWFRDFDGCSRATYTVSAVGDTAAPAPWRDKIVISDARIQDDGTVFLRAAVAFRPEPLERDSTYTLCQVEFTPPLAKEDGKCPGWDGAASFELQSVKVLLAGGKEVPVYGLDSKIVLTLKED